MQIAISRELRLRFYRDVVIGARQFGFATGAMTYAEPWLDDEVAGDLLRLIRRDAVRGLIVALHTSEEERRFAGLGIPVVNVSNGVHAPLLPFVSQDDDSVGRLAAAHLVACGCRGFGFWGRAGRSYSDQRFRGFVAGLRAVGRERSLQTAESDERGWAVGELKQWLQRLPRPAGVFAVHDMHASALVRAADEIGWRVPEDIALLGAGDDDLWVEYERVPLSSVRLPARRIGYEAAALLHALLAGRAPRALPIQVPVREVSVRRSTDVLHVDDLAVARALAYIREHALENPYVTEIARAAGVSLSALQARFAAALGRSPSDEVRRVRIVRAQDLLAETELPMSIVAERCGFANSQQFSIRFRAAVGETPSSYRQRFHRGGAR